MYTKVRTAFSKIKKKIIPQKHLHRVVTCFVCGHTSNKFNPISQFFQDQFHQHGFFHGLDKFETLELDVYECPKCQSRDRCRLMALYIDNILKKNPSKQYRLLDIAPSTSLTAFFKKYSNLSYRSCDLFCEDADDKVDITNMSLYPDHSFDIFICSHVLEHVVDDNKAAAELYRVLKPGGFGLALVPISLMIDETMEDPTIVSESERWKLYAQGDHVRLYSQKGFIALFEKAGFRVSLHDVTSFDDYSFRKYGIDPKGVLYVVHKL